MLLLFAACILLAAAWTHFRWRQRKISVWSEFHLEPEDDGVQQARMGLWFEARRRRCRKCNRLEGGPHPNEDPWYCEFCPECLSERLDM